MTTAMHRYTRRYKLELGDTVMMVEDGEWFLTDVLHRSEVDHIDTAAKPGKGRWLRIDTRRGLWIKGTFDAYDKNGHFIGHVPII
jgi:hypothetical protein